MEDEIPPLDSDRFDSWMERAVARMKVELLEEQWDDYITLVRRVAAHPDNRSGADKTHVERALEEMRRHYRQASRVG
jgi:hypothetical protein